MVRPSPNLIFVGAISLALTVVTVAFGPYPTGSIAVWGVVLLAIVVDLAMSVGGRSLAVATSAPHEVFAGETITVSVALKGWRGGAATGIRGRVAYPEGLEGPKDTVLEATLDGPRLVLPVRAKGRGTWIIERLWIGWRSWLGLFDNVRHFPLNVQILVTPNVRSLQAGKIDVAVRSALYGVKENVLVGEGSEFHQLRDFASGMDPRAIDWKRSARRRSLVAKEMRAERNHSIVFAIDNGYLMREVIGGLPKIDHNVAAALALAWAGILAGDRVGLFAFDARPRHYEAPQPGRDAFVRLRASAAGLDCRSVETNFTLALSHLYQRLRRRSLIVVFSDFVDSTTAELLVENLAMLNRQHLIMFAALRDPGLRTIAEGSPENLTDVARAVTATQMLRERSIVFERLARIGVLCVEADPHQLTGRLISTYLTVKARDML